MTTHLHARTLLRAVLLAPFLLFAVALAAALSLHFISAQSADAAVFALVPAEDVANPDGWTTDSGELCGTAINTCASRIDDDIDAPNDADYIQSPFGAENSTVTFRMSALPPDLGFVTDMTLRFRAFKEGGDDAHSVVVALRNDTSPIMVTPPVGAATLTNTPTEFSYTASNLTLLPGEVEGMFSVVIGHVTNPAPDTRIMISAITIEIDYVAVLPNPQLESTCGIDIVLVIDSSSSIDAAEMALQKDAFKNLVDALMPATPTEMGVVEFNVSANILGGFSSDPAAVKAAIDAATTVPLTNWDDGLHKARTLFPNRANPDLIIFASDGFPNTHGGHSGNPIQPFVGLSPSMAQAILQANAAKADGIRIVTLGIGLDIVGPQNLELISSPDATIMTDFGQLNDELEQLARDLCGSTVRIVKFYDANANGLDDDGQPITDWSVHIGNSVDINLLTPAIQNLSPGDYTVSENMPLESNWVATTPTSVNVSLEVDDDVTVAFGNVCLGAGGGKTIGFWTNKNGAAAFNGIGAAEALAMLSSLNLRNEKGSHFDPKSYAAFANWLKSASATNMSYMLSAQLAAMQLNVLAEFVDADALVYAPGLLSFGVPGLNDLGFISIADLIAGANGELGVNGLAVSGSTARAYQEALKDALDSANNDLTFVQSTPCPFSFQ